MLIVAAGPHSQGKSTLCQDLMLRSEFKDFQLLGNITRDIKAQGIDINEVGGDWSQSLVIAKHIEHALVPGNLLLDRCILDGIVYTAVLRGKHRVSEEVMQYATFVFNQLISSYDAIFYTEPELPLASDGVRSTDIVFFEEVKIMFEIYLRKARKETLVTRIFGTRQERVQAVLSTLQRRKLL